MRLSKSRHWQRSLAMGSLLTMMTCVTTAQEVAVGAPELDAAPPSEALPSPPHNQPQTSVDDGHGSFLESAAAAEIVIDGTLVEAKTLNPEGSRVPVTEYHFEVHEWFDGARDTTYLKLREIGGITEAGQLMTTPYSHRLTPGRRYIVLVHQNGETMLLPFAGLLQVFEGGTLVADERGRIVTGIIEGRLATRAVAEIESLGYGVGQSSPPADQMSPPDGSTIPIPTQPDPPPALPALALERILEHLRQGNGSSKKTLIPPKEGGEARPAKANKWQWCGTIRGANNYYAWIPDDDHWQWWSDSSTNWNTLVEDNPSGDDWLVGFFTSDGNPIRDRAPVAGDGNNHTGVPTSALLSAGGYGTWATLGNPNGINFTWYASGTTCAEIVEVDSFVNPSIGNDGVQFRKSMTHELGHALGQSTGGAGGHEDEYFAIMYSGTFRQPPNYSSIWYGRMDDMNGVRSMLGAANGNWPGSWVLEQWVDMATWSQTHQNSGSPGSLIMTELDRYLAYPGDTVTLQGIHVENRGNLDATNVPFDVYFSTNTTISSADFNVFSGVWSEFPENTHWTNGTLTLSIPTNIPQGDYFIGWAVGAAEDQRSTANDTAILRDDFTTDFALRQITIGCGLDTYEPDDSAGLASPLASGGSQSHSICGIGDEDWAVFSLSQPSAVTVETSGPSGDTRMWLYDAGLNLIEFDDDDGASFFSRIERSCSAGLLPAGNYFVRIDEFGDNGAIPSYSLSLDASTCPGVIFLDSFELGNTSAWSATAGSS